MWVLHLLPPERQLCNTRTKKQRRLIRVSVGQSRRRSPASLSRNQLLVTHSCTALLPRLQGLQNFLRQQWQLNNAAHGESFDRPRQSPGRLLCGKGEDTVWHHTQRCDISYKTSSIASMSSSHACFGEASQCIGETQLTEQSTGCSSLSLHLYRKLRSSSTECNTDIRTLRTPL